MNRRIAIAAVALIGLGVCAAGASAQQTFKEMVGPVQIGPVTQTSPLLVPFITWGGDMATFYANGGLETKPGTIFQKQGLNLKLTPGDDFVQQVRDYLAGKTPFLRGTFRMIGMASEAIGSDPRTKGVVILQLTWSAGDHLVVRSHVKTISDLKGKTLVLQTGGPHVGMLDDILKTARLSWDDIKIVWAKDLTGSPDCPAEIFRKNPNIDGCFAISPDMIGLCGGLQNTGTGAEGTVKGARVLVSTAEMARSIADVYVCRKDFYDANKALITRFVAGYLKACEEIAELKKEYEKKGSPAYTQLLTLTQSIYGKDIIPTLEEAHGLLSDCVFVHYQGNVEFFTQPNNLHGFEAFQKSALDLAVGRGYAKIRTGFFPSGLDYTSSDFVGYLKGTATAEFVDIPAAPGASADAIYEFSVSFDPNITEFDPVRYGAEFQHVVETADKFGNAVFLIRGHCDPSKVLYEIVQAGMKKGILQRTGTPGNYRYSLRGKPLDLSQTAEIVKMIEAGEFDGVPEFNPRATLQAALNISQRRAEAVRDAIIAYAQQKGIKIDKTQFQAVGVGVREPFIAVPRDKDQIRQNTRAQFRLVRVAAEMETVPEL